ETSSTDCAAYDRHVTEGLVEYHPELLPACLQKFALPCEEANPYPCQFEVLRGKVADGQPCEDFEACGVVSGCINTGRDACGAGCVRLGAESEACGAYCGGASPCLDIPLCGSGLFCLDGTCAKTKGVGETCAGPQAVQCGFGLFCDADP